MLTITGQLHIHTYVCTLVSGRRNRKNKLALRSRKQIRYRVPNVCRPARNDGNACVNAYIADQLIAVEMATATAAERYEL